MATHSQTDNLKRLLHDAKDKHNQSLFNHLCDTLAYIDNNPNDPLNDDLVQLSQFIKSTRFVNSKLQTERELHHKHEKDPYGLKQHCKKLSGLLEEKAKHPKTYIQDFNEINCDWNIAGFGFGEEEALILHQTLKRLAANGKCDIIRFLGIIRGSKKDYFVIYGRLSAHVHDQLPDDWEKSGSGANSLTFWVSNDCKIGITWQ